MVWGMLRPVEISQHDVEACWILLGLVDRLLACCWRNVGGIRDLANNTPTCILARNINGLGHVEAC